MKTTKSNDSAINRLLTISFSFDKLSDQKVPTKARQRYIKKVTRRALAAAVGNG